MEVSTLIRVVSLVIDIFAAVSASSKFPFRFVSSDMNVSPVGQLGVRTKTVCEIERLARTAVIAIPASIGLARSLAHSSDVKFDFVAIL